MKKCMVIGLLFVCVFPAFFAQAQEDVLRVAYNDLPPWKMISPVGDPTGIDIEFLRLFADRLGLTIEYVTLPFKRGLHMVRNGDIDLMTGVLRRPEREEYAHYISPPYKTHSDKAFFVLRQQTSSSIREYKDLYGKNVGTQIGVKYYPQFDNDTIINKHPVKSTALNIKMLLAGRIDAFIVTETVGDYYLAQFGLSDDVVKADYVYALKQEVFIILSKKSKFSDRLAAFNAAMKGLVDENALQDCIDDSLQFNKN